METCSLCDSANLIQNNNTAVCGYCCSVVTPHNSTCELPNRLLFSHIENSDSNNILLIGFEYDSVNSPKTEKAITYINKQSNKNALRAGLRFGKFDSVYFSSRLAEAINFDDIKDYLAASFIAFVAYSKNKDRNTFNQSIFILDKMLQKSQQMLGKIDSEDDDLALIKIEKRCELAEHTDTQDLFDRECAIIN